MKTLRVELEPELIKETISILHEKVRTQKIKRDDIDRELETIQSRIKSLEDAIRTNGKPQESRKTPEAIVLISSPERLQIGETGRRSYGKSEGVILSFLKTSKDKPLKLKQIMDLSGASYATTRRVLIKLKERGMVKCSESGRWTSVN